MQTDFEIRQWKWHGMDGKISGAMKRTDRDPRDGQQEIATQEDFLRGKIMGYGQPDVAAQAPPLEQRSDECMPAARRIDAQVDGVHVILQAQGPGCERVRSAHDGDIPLASELLDQRPALDHGKRAQGEIHRYLASVSLDDVIQNRTGQARMGAAPAAVGMEAAA